jgi:transcriptional regulator PpsR
LNLAQPDVILRLDADGIIREAKVSPHFLDQDVKGWLGRHWTDTVVDPGSERLRSIIDVARASGVSAFRHVTQRFPSGAELPMEYTTVLLDSRAGFMAIGKNLHADIELQSRLVASQQKIERDHLKLRESETKYRLLFDSSQEPSLLVNAGTLRIMEINPAAAHAIGFDDSRTVIGRSFASEIAFGDRDTFQSMLLRAREQPRSQGVLIHIGTNKKAWLVRATLMPPAHGPVVLLQLSPGSPGGTDAIQESILTDDLIDRLPDAFVVLNPEGIIRRANRAFLDLVEVGAKASVIGERLTRWLWRPGADLTVLLANVERHGSVRLFHTTMQGELGTTSEVEISAAGSSDDAPKYLGVIIRDVGRRIVTSGDESSLRSELGVLAERIGKTPLRKLVKDTVSAVELSYLKSALNLANGNRTVTAELLGLSRQSLYAKLNRYGLEKSDNSDSQ